MHGKMIIIGTDGSETVTEYTGTIPLADMQSAVGGYIEIIPMFERFRGETCVAFCNEEGKMYSLDYNRKATEHWRAVHSSRDFLVGPVAIVIGNDEFLRAL